LNALLGQPQQEAKFARVSRKPGKTRCLNVFGVGGAQGGTRTAVKAGMSAALLSKAREGGKHHSPAGRRNRDDDGTRSENYISGGSGSSGSSIVVVDCPGYGFGSRDAWGTEVLKYLRTRRQLRRAFLLISPEHGVKRSDLQVLELLHSLGTPHQIVLSKIDKILYPRGAPKNAGEPLDPKNVEALQDICAEVRKTVVADRRGTVLEDIICTSAEVPGWNGEIRMGIDGLRYEICRAAGLHAGALGKTEKREWRERLTISPTEASGMDALQAAMR
jgi:GTP-binding protein